VLCFVETGSKGRPSLDITDKQLRLLQSNGFTAKQMAMTFKCSQQLIYKCSQQLIYKRLHTAGLHQHKKYSSLTDDALREKFQHFIPHFQIVGWRLLHCNFFVTLLPSVVQLHWRSQHIAKICRLSAAEMKTPLLQYSILSCWCFPMELSYPIHLRCLLMSGTNDWYSVVSCHVSTYQFNR